jgi:hypothetical protein
VLSSLIYDKNLTLPGKKKETLARLPSNQNLSNQRKISPLFIYKDMKIEELEKPENTWLNYIEDEIDMHISVFAEMMFRSIQASITMDEGEKKLYSNLQIQFNFLLEMQRIQANQKHKTN